MRISKSDSLIYIAFWLMVFGSIVDIWQAAFGVKRYLRRWKKRLEANIRAKIIVEEFEKRNK